MIMKMVFLCTYSDHIRRLIAQADTQYGLWEKTKSIVHVSAEHTAAFTMQVVSLH